ncbi:MAG TPA: methyltransferase [Catalimonadaceae bacterium]|nr:methyltransferase [Catalimonadaceae bacterium]
MGNSWFQFKEFRIEQGRTSMKVCTDSCIFGAYVALRESEQSSPVTSVLDVGSGTGLLSLMIAQKFPQSKIVAVEKDEGAFEDCRLNFQASPWSDNLTVHHISIVSFIEGNAGGFECVICNPPFFLNHLRSPDQRRNQSMHNTGHSWVNWLKSCSAVCLPQGRIWLLLDPGTWEKTLPLLGTFGLFVSENLTLTQSKGRIWRNLVCLSKNKTDLSVTSFQDVYESPGILHPVVKRWLYDYYL